MTREVGFPVVTEPRITGLFPPARGAVSMHPEGGREICSATVGDKLLLPRTDLLNGLHCESVSLRVSAGRHGPAVARERVLLASVTDVLSPAVHVKPTRLGPERPIQGGRLPFDQSPGEPSRELGWVGRLHLNKDPGRTRMETCRHLGEKHSPRNST